MQIRQSIKNWTCTAYPLLNTALQASQAMMLQIVYMATISNQSTPLQKQKDNAFLLIDYKLNDRMDWQMF